MSRRPADEDETGGRKRLPPELVALAYARAERGEPSFPTEESLAGQDEATTELRQALDDVRKLLDVEAAPPPPRRRRRRLPLALLLVLVVALLVALVVVVLPRGGTDPATAGVAAETSPATGSLPGTGPGVDAAGTAVGVRAAGPDALDVIEQTVLAAPETAPLELRLPGLGGLGGRVAGLRPEVTALRVSVDGVPVRPEARDPGRWTVTPPAAGAIRVVATYRLTGALLAGRAASRPDRAIAVVAPILGGPVAARGNGALPLVVRGLRPWVIGVSCPDAPAGRQTCGTEDAGGWTARIPASDSPVVLLQVETAGSWVRPGPARAG